MGSALALRVVSLHGPMHWVSTVATVTHVMLTSGLVLYFVSGKYESLVQRVMYGSIRRNWRPVRVMYAEEAHSMMGFGGFYPREPTLLLHPPMFPFDQPPPAEVDGGRIPAQLAVSFNNAYVGESLGDFEVTGGWDGLRVILDGANASPRVGFPSTLIKRVKVPRGTDRS